jgi:RHS repeat-associated protein
MVTSAGGWPVSSDTFYPFGQEQNPTIDPNRYKFTGKERDTESGLDYFGARYYGRNMGRFMSWDDGEDQSPNFQLTPKAFAEKVWKGTCPVVEFVGMTFSASHKMLPLLGFRPVLRLCKRRHHQ